MQNSTSKTNMQLRYKSLKSFQLPFVQRNGNFRATSGLVSIPCTRPAIVHYTYSRIRSHHKFCSFGCFCCGKAESLLSTNPGAAQLHVTVVVELSPLNAAKKNGMEWAVPFPVRSRPVIFERAPVIRTERVNFLMTYTMHVAIPFKNCCQKSCRHWELSIYYCKLIQGDASYN